MAKGSGGTKSSSWRNDPPAIYNSDNYEYIVGMLTYTPTLSEKQKVRYGGSFSKTTTYGDDMGEIIEKVASSNDGLASTIAKQVMEDEERWKKTKTGKTLSRKQAQVIASSAFRNKIVKERMVPDFDYDPFA